jgi:hypothetical protein
LPESLSAMPENSLKQKEKPAARPWRRAPLCAAPTRAPVSCAPRRRHCARPGLLQSLSDAVGVAGSAYITFNKITGRPDWACFSGPSQGAKPEYVSHYAALDPYSPLLDASWMKLSECLPDAQLRRSEWYADFVLACGVRDIVGTRLRDAVVPRDFRPTPAALASATKLPTIEVVPA